MHMRNKPRKFLQSMYLNLTVGMVEGGGTLGFTRVWASISQVVILGLGRGGLRFMGDGIAGHCLALAQVGRKTGEWRGSPVAMVGL